MHNDLHIHRFQARHRVPDAAGRQLAQDAQTQLLDGELEAALARVAAPDEVVLLRRLSARVRLSHRGSDRDNARAWGDALALSLQRALQQADPQQLLRFASHQQALHAFVADALQGRGTRDWAWQRLGLLPTTRSGTADPVQRQQALLRLLADDAEQGIPLLRGLLAAGLWPSLVTRLRVGELRGLAQTVLLRLAGPTAAGFGQMPAADAALSVATFDRDDRAATDGAIAAPAWWAATLQAAADAGSAHWALRLAAMLSAPALARRGAAAVDAQLHAWMRAAGTGVAPVSTPAIKAAEPAEPTQRTQAAATRDSAKRAPAPAGSTPQRAVAPASAGAEGAARTAAARRVESDLPPIQPDATAPVAIEPLIGLTQCGGLMYLAPLLPLCGALPLLEDPVLWPDLPQALHQLALQLWPLAPADPAALAFCGLMPLHPPPPPLQPSPTQLATLQQVQALLLAHLEQRLPDWRGPGLLAQVLCRPARISADPGWIEVIFALRDVAIELRRAALDLDPGFLPWLGVVLRYRYE